MNQCICIHIYIYIYIVIPTDMHLDSSSHDHIHARIQWKGFQQISTSTAAVRLRSARVCLRVGFTAWSHRICRGRHHFHWRPFCWWQLKLGGMQARASLVEENKQPFALLGDRVTTVVEQLPLWSIHIGSGATASSRTIWDVNLGSFWRLQRNTNQGTTLTAEAEGSRSSMSGESREGSTAHVSSQLTTLVPSFDPSKDELEQYVQKIEMLTEIWPAEKLNELATRLILNTSGAAFQKTSAAEDRDPDEWQKGYRVSSESLGWTMG